MASALSVDGVASVLGEYTCGCSRVVIALVSTQLQPAHAPANAPAFAVAARLSRAGRLGMLQWLCRVFPPCEQQAHALCLGAASADEIGVVEWLASVRTHARPFFYSTVALSCTGPRVLEWVWPHLSTDDRARVCSSAACCNKKKVLGFCIRRMGLSPGRVSDLALLAAEYRNWEIAYDCLFASGARSRPPDSCLTVDLCRVAVVQGNVDALERLLHHDATGTRYWCRELAKHAAWEGKEHVLQWARARRLPIPLRYVQEAAASAGHHRVADWCQRQLALAHPHVA